MLCYFISRQTFKIINCVEVVDYSVGYNLDCSGKTSISVAADPGAADGDFVILKDENAVKFKGVVESFENEDNSAQFNVSCLEIEHCFDRQIFITDTDIIKSEGLEDFVAKTIKSYFSESGDAFDDMAYIECNVLTHTKVNSKPSGSEGIYNFKTYIGNIKEQYGIFLDFEFTKTKLIINIHKKEQATMRIDTTITDVISCIETYKINVLSRLNILWKNALTGEESKRYFYLHSDRSISEINEDRVAGTIKSMRVEAETEAEMIQAARDEFKSNSYAHSIEAVIISASKLYPIDELYVGHEVAIKTAVGIKESIISEISFATDSQTISVKFGILKISLTDKLK